MIITIVLLLSVKSLFAIPCSLSRRMGLAPEFTDCLKTIPKNTTELDNFIGTVIEYVKNSPYPHLFMGGPNGLAPFDVLGELTNLKSQAIGWEETVLNFYEQIRNIIGKLKDPHSGITFPFLGSFAYLLPYNFAPVAENENSFKLTANVLTSTYTATYTATDYTGYIIDKMDLKGGEYELAAVALSELALDIGNAGHDPHALFNSVVKKGNIFSAGELFRPDERYNPVVKLKGKDKNGSPVDITIPWLGYYGGADEGALTFDQLNPRVGEVEMTHGRSGNGKKHIKKDSIKHFLPHMMLYNQIPPIFLERERMMKEIKRQVGVDSKFSANSAKHESRLITSMYEKKLATHQPQPSSSPSLSRLLSSVDASMLPAIDLDAVTLENLYEFVDAGESTCTIYADAANKLGYIRYKSFSQGLSNNAVTATFFSEFGTGYKKMVDKGVTDVIFDVRGNPGGMLLIVEEFTDFFFHNSISPADLDTDVLLGGPAGGNSFAGGNYITLLVQNLTAPASFYKLEGGGNAPVDILSAPVEKTHDNKTTSPSTTFKANYTQRAFFTQRLAPSIHDTYGAYSPFDPDHFYIVTDGDCASCCGIFTKLAVESKAAHVLGYGVNPTKKDDISTYVPGNCAGSLYGTPQVEATRQTLEGLTTEQIEGVGLTQDDIDLFLTFLPPQFERTGVSFGVTDFEFFSRNPEHTNQTLYMVPAVVEDVLPLQVSSEPDTDAVLKEIVAVTKNLYIDKADSDSAAVASVPAVLLALVLAMLMFW